MKAVAVFPTDKTVRVIDHPETPLLGETEVRLKVLDIGVCGTDREIARFDYGTLPPGSPYLVIGHESLGEVIDVGSEDPAARSTPRPAICADVPSL